MQREAYNLRWIAFCGVTMSTVATLSCVISVPLLYNYLQHVQSVMENEVKFCRSRSGNIWREITRTQVFLRLWKPLNIAILYYFNLYANTYNNFER